MKTDKEETEDREEDREPDGWETLPLWEALGLVCLALTGLVLLVALFQ